MKREKENENKKRKIGRKRGRNRRFTMWKSVAAGFERARRAMTKTKTKRRLLKVDEAKEVRHSFGHNKSFNAKM